MNELDRGERRAAKPHQCFDCYRTIPKGERYHYFTGVMDGSAYTLSSHLDCHAAAMEFISEGHPSDYYDGIPPLYDMVCDSGEHDLWCDESRGHYPHVVTRFELIDQLAEIRLAERLARP